MLSYVFLTLSIQISAFKLNQEKPKKRGSQGSQKKKKKSYRFADFKLICFSN